MPKAMSANGARKMEYTEIFGLRNSLGTSKYLDFYLHYSKDRIILSTSSDPTQRGISEVIFSVSVDTCTVRQCLTLIPYRGKGLSTMLHLFLAQRYRLVYSDRVLSSNATRLWKRLSELPNVEVVFGKRGDPDSPHCLRLI